MKDQDKKQIQKLRKEIRDKIADYKYKLQQELYNKCIELVGHDFCNWSK